MSRVVLARIDDRLIHGQVVTAWVNHVKANTIIIADEELSSNKLMQRIYMAAAPNNIELKILTIDETITYLKEEENRRVLLLGKTPQVFEKLIENNIEIDEVILGGMGSKPDRKKVIRNSYANEEELESMKSILSKGIDVAYQIVPDEKKVNLKNNI
ncbi:PTS sugar transporter subunit IIB [Carnobacteriaceae bacterium 52-44]